MRWAVLLLAVASLGVADRPPKKQVDRDRQDLQGAWQVLGLEEGGERARADCYFLTVQGDKVTQDWGGQNHPLSAPTPCGSPFPSNRPGP